MDARELTRDEKKKIRSLVTGMCANYDRETGLCLPLDCGCYMLHKCWTGAYCRYFREAVLPLDPELLAALFFVAGGAHLLGKFGRRREELLQKLLKLKR